MKRWTLATPLIGVLEMKEIATLVPQLFYDLIGRFLPGAVLLGLGALLFVDLGAAAPVPTLTARASATLALGMGAVVAYILGVLLGAIGTAVREWEWSTTLVEKIGVEIPTSEALLVATQNRGGLTRGQLSFLYDALQIQNPGAGARLVKLRAEQHMCLVLLTGAFVMLIVCWVSSRPSSSPFSTPVAVSMLCVVAAGAYLFHVHLAFRARRLLLNCAHVVPELSRLLPGGSTK